MIDPIGNSSGQMPEISTIGNYSLSDEQKNILKEILQQYNPDSMSAESMKSLREEVRAAGIKPGEDMKNIMEEAGFKVGPPRDRKEGMRGAGDAGGKLDMPSFLSELVEQLQNGRLNQEEQDKMIDILESNGFDVRGLIVDDDG